MMGRCADFVDNAGRIVAFDPATREPGQSVLLVRRDALRDFLIREKIALFWTLLSEKNIYPKNVPSKEWLGRLTILGTYAWEGDGIRGDFRSEFFKGDGFRKNALLLNPNQKLRN
jgi:hypothetical protein